MSVNNGGVGVSQLVIVAKKKKKKKKRKHKFIGHSHYRTHGTEWSTWKHSKQNVTKPK